MLPVSTERSSGRSPIGRTGSPVPSSPWSAWRRGRRLVDEARPELVARGWMGGQQSGCMRLENRGRGVARNLQLQFTGTGNVARGGEIEAGTEGITREINLSESPLFHARQAGPFHFTVTYSDRFGNDYKVLIPVSQAPRANGGFNMMIPWDQYEHEEPRLKRRTLYRIGR